MEQHSQCSDIEERVAEIASSHSDIVLPRMPASRLQGVLYSINHRHAQTRQQAERSVVDIRQY